MKHSLWMLLLILAACSPSSSPAGEYFNKSESDYSIAWTTLTVEKATSSSRDLYVIIRKVRYQRKLDNTQLGPVEESESRVSGPYDPANRAIYTDLPDPYILEPDGRTLTLGGVKYTRKR